MGGRGSLLGHASTSASLTFGRRCGLPCGLIEREFESTRPTAGLSGKNGLPSVPSRTCLNALQVYRRVRYTSN
jgi:hypothetical protein